MLQEVLGELFDRYYAGQYDPLVLERLPPIVGPTPEAAHLEPVTPELAWWGRRACRICGAEYGEPHNWDVHSAEALA